ncbi:hypothetical protein K435DRAFT_692107 [Dendrothele bispora CBS 962.96]|uniref:Uncharacterized protein n=1 Tax=Dendrothele bispora (strain CBS 962.96) TaxID=1314807 RepID=A0A4S8L175_DENBC|nr:hypothetical protein K435DRAFT_692107 [Dendrothele bispora CBS 962.96]
MRGISIPLTAYTRVAELYLKQLKVKHSRRDPNVIENAILLRDATRAYNRILLRLRAQAEMDPDQFTPTANTPTDHSQPQVPTTIMEEGNNKASPSLLTGNNGQSSSEPHLPSMFRLRRAPLLRVFIPSPEGDWLSDTSVSQCEAEIKYAGLSHLVRMGDVVWDIAVGDNGNFGRMIWDGKYLIDLDYTYSEVGDVPKYIPILAFPPSYFYRVLRTSPSSSSDPLVRIDISHWGEEIATNLQLLQNRGRMERATTVYHNTNWVHQSWFRIKPPQSQHTSDSNNNNDNKGVPVPGFAGHFIHPTWYGKIVIETEGTADSLTDLQDRCGPKAFPNRVKPVTKTVVGSSQRSAERDKDARTAFRIVRERSQPGEIWLRTVSAKERRRV